MDMLIAITNLEMIQTWEPCWRLQGCKIESRLWLSCTDLYYARGAQGVGTAHEGRGATSQLDLKSLTPLSVAGCGRLQLGVLHFATSVGYCKQLIIDPTFYTGRLLAIEDFTFFYHYMHQRMPSYSSATEQLKPGIIYHRQFKELNIL